jgi:hypothetical protein
MTKKILLGISCQSLLQEANLDSFHQPQLITDITAQTCWDADRLDLGRVGTTPKAEYLCTNAARDPDMIEWAHGRAVK